MSHNCRDGFLCTQNSRLRGKKNVLLTALHAIERYGPNGAGTLGSLYDARTDKLLTRPFISESLIERKTAQEKPTCELKRIDRSNPDNMLKIIDIDANLRLSIILDMTAVTEGTSGLYNYEIPTEHTVRLISYFHVLQEEHLINDIKLIRESLQDSQMDSNETHIITEIERGLDFVIVLQYPIDTNIDEMDSLLKQLCQCFVRPDTAFLFNADQKKIDALEYSIFTLNNDIRSLSKTESFTNNCQRIRQILRQNVHSYPLLYTMHPTKCVYDENLFDIKNYQQTDRTVVEKIEERVFPLLNKLRVMKRLFNDMQNVLSRHIENLYAEMHGSLERAEDTYGKILKILAQRITLWRDGLLEVDLYNENVLNNPLFESLNLELMNLQVRVKCYQACVHLLNQLKINCHVEYLSVVDLGKYDDNQETLEAELLSTAQNSCKHYLCFTEELVECNVYDSLKPELDQMNASTHLVLVDLSSCSWKLKSMKILPPLIPPERSESVRKPKEINVLLVGETGVDKSTFINAFVNYLAFQSFQQAASNKPMVLIPVSFLITTGDQFVEHKIQFGQIDPNEKHNDTGESVTQRCKSYLFPIEDNIKLRLIDTPGLGDTRGVQQDDKNIEQILTYTSNLTHLNAICFLLKPNTSRLHALFRSCFTELFHFLGPNARENIIFCFTNTRATFYTPGNTVTPLKEMLKMLPDDHTPAFAKLNTFCFDSESFRYLAVIRAGYQLVFDEQQKLDFQKSWEKSAAESIRLLDYVKTRSEYKMNDWRSIKHAQIKITVLARPVLETIRNALRNLILWKLENNQLVLELKAQPIEESVWICTNGPHKIAPVQKIPMVTHPMYGHRVTSPCSCPIDQHLSVFYALEYHPDGPKGMKFDSETETMKDRLLHGCVILSHFLLNIAQVSDNPFLRWIDLFRTEQEYLCTKDPSAAIHFDLSRSLHQLKEQYETGLLEMLSSNDKFELDTVYNCMNELLKYNEIAEQMNATQKSQMIIMKNSEYAK